MQLARLVFVMILVAVAAALATPPGRLPLALRGLKRLLARDAGASVSEEKRTVSVGRRVAAFALIVLAFVLCIV